MLEESVIIRSSTYKAPNPNTTIKPIFCLFGSCSAPSKGIGMANMRMSVAILREALVNQKIFWSRHFPFG